MDLVRLEGPWQQHPKYVNSSPRHLLAIRKHHRPIAPCAFRIFSLRQTLSAPPPGERPPDQSSNIPPSMALAGGESVDAPGRVSTRNTHVGNATLLGLPVELQKMILEYCSTNADKKNVCATSKRLQAVMTPLLYHRMELGSAQLTKRFLRTLGSSHLGLPYVRVLSIRFLAKAQINILCRLIFALPKNILTRFEYVY